MRQLCAMALFRVDLEKRLVKLETFYRRILNCYSNEKPFSSLQLHHGIESIEHYERHFVID